MSDNQLSQRELEIVKLICNGHSNAQIAKLLGISTSTVRTHHKNILKKADVKKAILLVRIALRNGWIV
ncbi:MAG: response regulator transcription factor [Bacteroidetes bacterium]|nr:response regulator transcription factor [Bacteroidota bacterium]HNR20618.1 LuxR C-terminal-related transcriptional regulator [Bacteroidia bacterium]HNU33158.1 LuxR C-terminal-related transcriptional regulator [Bacteroidia bacterium]